MAPKISLSETERSLFNVLLNSVKTFPPPESKGQEVTLRVAGGWVRDKIIDVYENRVPDEKKAPDIDISLDCITGVQFAECVNKYLEHSGIETHSIGLVKQNPDQSKHLEVAILTINDLKIDCLQLRSEEYASNSRIPEIQFGTPLQDALRRDFRANALFYNINKDQVEDFTGHGLSDLENRVLVTPMDPRVTFMDDPLRCLRGVRFACRLNFKLDEGLIVVARSAEFRQALAEKVSRERIGVEIDSAFRSGSPQIAIDELHKMGLLDIIFAPIEKWGSEDVRRLTDEGHEVVVKCIGQVKLFADNTKGNVSTEWLRTVFNDKSWRNKVLSYAGVLFPQDEAHYVALRAAAADSSSQASGLFAQGKKARAQTPSFDIIRLGIRLPKKDADDTTEITTACMLLSDPLDSLRRGEAGPVKANPSSPNMEAGCSFAGRGCENGDLRRLRVARLVRTCGPLWREGLILCVGVLPERAAVDLPGARDTVRNFVDGLMSILEVPSDDLEATTLRQTLEEGIKTDSSDLILNACLGAACRFVAEAAVLGVEEAFSFRGAVTGVDILKVLKGSKGPKLREVLHDAVLFQLLHPDATPEVTLAWLSGV